MRLAFYAGASTAAAAACLLKAFHERPNFYSATVYLSQSNACLLILTNLLLVGACSFMYSLQRLLYGSLRPIEIEQLSEKAWYAVLDTLLAMPSFREDVGGWLLTMFVLLLAGKVWGWIGEGRVDILEQQPPSNPRLFHARLSTSLAISVAFNVWMAWWCFETVVANPRPGMMVIFTFEFTIQIIFSTFTLLRYLLAAAEIKVVKQQTQQAIENRKNEIRAERAAARQNETEDGTPTPALPLTDEPIDVDENEVDVPGWEEKRRWLFVLEVVTDFLKLVIYIVFFTISVTFNGLPMHIMRDVYMTFASFSKRVNDYLNYRKATSDMNARYPDATTEEIRGDACIVCREDMVAWEQPAGGAQAQPAADQAAGAPAATPAGRRDEGLRAKKLPCGHILHLRCLKAWLERQQVCPTCRRPVIAAIPPTAPGQPGAPAVNPGVPGAPRVPGAPEQQPGGQRPVRARFFNLGPVRIGFANGPPGQMNDIVNQLQNPNAQGGNQAAVQPADQQGPNHLGLQVPYVQNGMTGGATTAVNGVPVAPGSRATMPVQIQLMQLEQRLMQEAHNLRLEQQQLGILRAMEGEMARLRAVQLPTQRPVGTDLAAQRSAGAVGVQQAGLHVPDYSVLPGIPQQMQSGLPSQQLLQGQVNQQMGSGHEHLPPGMVLPEGWSVMPLQRTEAMGAAPAPQSSVNTEASGNNIQPPPTQGGGVDTVTAPSTEASINGMSPPRPQQSQGPVSEQSVESQARGPTDEQGSPLFVPTAQPTSSEAPVPSSLPANSTVPDLTDAHVTPAPAAQTNTPWDTGSWGFDQAVDNQPSESQKQPESVSVSPQDKQEQGSQPTYTGKGKGRAVEMEDAPDSET